MTSDPASRRTRPLASRPFSVPGYPLASLLFIVAAAAIVLNTVIAQPGRAVVGIAVVLLGVPAYLFWRAQLKASARTAARAPRT